MKLKLLLLIVLFSPLLAATQNIPACDSLEIDCCSFNTIIPNTITIEVSNYSSNIFSYPGFILFNTSMDTVAIETVNYYGIGWDQIFSLNIVSPIDLPFEGILELHTGFYSSHECTFPITIPDSTLAEINTTEEDLFQIFPNPATNKLSMITNNQTSIDYLQIVNINGKIVKEFKNPALNNIGISDLKAGVYFVLIKSSDRNTKRFKLIKK